MPSEWLWCTIICRPALSTFLVIQQDGNSNMETQTNNVDWTYGLKCCCCRRSDQIQWGENNMTATKQVDILTHFKYNTAKRKRESEVLSGQKPCSNTTTGKKVQTWGDTLGCTTQKLSKPLLRLNNVMLHLTHIRKSTKGSVLKLVSKSKTKWQN